MKTETKPSPLPLGRIRITSRKVKAWGACWGYLRIDQSVPPGGVSILQVLFSDISSGDKWWTMRHALGEGRSVRLADTISRTLVSHFRRRGIKTGDNAHTKLTLVEARSAALASILDLDPAQALRHSYNPETLTAEIRKAIRHV